MSGTPGGPAKCIVCGSEDVAPFSDLIYVPVLATILWKTREEALQAPRGTIRLGYCDSCGHVFNLEFDPELIEYTQTYENSLHFSPLFQGYAEELAGYLRDRYKLHGKTVLEIGCGQGDFLRMLTRDGENRGIGYDPSYSGDPGHRNGRGGITVHRRPFAPGDSAQEADLVVCRQVLEHIPSPPEFLSAVGTALRDPIQSAVFFEVPDVMKALKDLDIWTIVYEHCSYFNQHSLRYLLSAAGFEILEERLLYEGLFIGIEASGGRQKRTEGIRRLEELAQLRQYVEAFKSIFADRLTYWRGLLEAGRGGRTVLWGAGVRGVLFLNFLGASSEEVALAVDINPRKHGTYVAGTGHIIGSPESLKTDPPDRVILANPIYREEVIGTLAQLGIQCEVVSV